MPYPHKPTSGQIPRRRLTEMTSTNTKTNNTTRSRQPTRCPSEPPFDCVALLLQGGGALGAYQGGVYEALAEVELHPNWVAGVSIGAINAALIAGNPPENALSGRMPFGAGSLKHPWDPSLTISLPARGPITAWA